MNKDYSGIDDSELAPGQPVTTSLVTRMRDDPLAVCQNHPAAQAVDLFGNFVPRTLWYSIAGTFEWIVPDGVHRIRLTLVGAGGGGESESGIDGEDGENTSFTIDAVARIAEGGEGGKAAVQTPASSSNIPFGTGLTIVGQTGKRTATNEDGGSCMYGNGGVGGTDLSTDGEDGADATGFGSGGGGGFNDNVDDPATFGRGGAAGAVATMILSVTPGTTADIVVGAGGAGGTGGGFDGGNGMPGLLIIEY